MAEAMLFQYSMESTLANEVVFGLSNRPKQNDLIIARGLQLLNLEGNFRGFTANSATHEGAQMKKTTLL